MYRCAPPAASRLPRNSSHRHIACTCKHAVPNAAIPRRAAAFLVPLTVTLLQAPHARAAAPAGSPLVLDRSRLLSASRLAAIEQQLGQLEQDTGFVTRVVIADGQLDPRGGGYTGADLRAAFGQRTPSTLYILVDPTQRAILAFAAGDAVLKQLYGQFLAELQGRYGNQFFVRDEGADEAVSRTVAAVATCLRKRGGCAAVPGIADEGRWLTLAPSVVAGAVLGWALRQEPAGPVTSSGAWAVVTAPLWLFLLGTFGIGPVVQRSDDLAELLPNLGSFALAAGLLFLTPIFGKSPLTKTEKRDVDDS